MALQGGKDKRKTVFPIGGLLFYLVLILLYVVLSPGDLPVEHVLVGLTLLYMVGLFDDYRNVNPFTKLTLQLISISYLVYFGVRVWFITNPVVGMIYLETMSIPVTIAWIFVMVNAINLLDGLEGLASGLAIISSVFIMLIAWDLGRVLPALMALILVCVLVLIKILSSFYPGMSWELGNAGSMLVGAQLAIISILGAVKGVAFVSLLLPLLVMGIPLLNGLVGIYNIFAERTRLSQLRSKMLHYKLLDWGLSGEQSRFVFYLAGLLFGLLGFLLAKITTDKSMVVILIVFSILVLAVRELRSGLAAGDRYLDNVKRLKDLQLMLFQLRGLISYRKANGETRGIKKELEEARTLISNRIPSYFTELDTGISGVGEGETLDEEFENLIELIGGIIHDYQDDLENLDYILADRSEELEDIVGHLERLYHTMK